MILSACSVLTPPHHVHQRRAALAVTALAGELGERMEVALAADVLENVGNDPFVGVGSPSA